MSEAMVTNILPDGQLWVREVLDDGTTHRRVVDPLDDPTKEQAPGVKALMRKVHTTPVKNARRAFLAKE